MSNFVSFERVVIENLGGFFMDKFKLMTKVLNLKEYLKSSKSVYEKDLNTYTFYNKKE